MQDRFSRVLRKKPLDIDAAITAVLGVPRRSDAGVPSRSVCDIVVSPSTMREGYLTTREAAARSGISASQITLLLRRKVLQGERLDLQWLVSEESLSSYLANRPRPGRKKAPKRS